MPHTNVRCVRDDVDAEIERLRLWMEFIHLNSDDAKEFAATALRGSHVPEGFTGEE